MRIVNLTMRSVALAVCITAATVLSGCFLTPVASQSEPPSWDIPAPEDVDETFADIDITRPMPDAPDYDEWVNWTTGRDEAYAQQVSEDLALLGQSLGISGMESPSDEYIDGGWIGVAPYGAYCIIAVNVSDPKAFEQGVISLSIFSRINLDSEVIAMPTDDYDSLAAFASHYKSWCSEGGSFPGMPPGTEIDIPVDQPGISA